MIRALIPAPGGLKVFLGLTAEDHSKLVHGKVLALDCADLTERVVEIVIGYKPTQSELLRELAEAGLVGPQTEFVRGQPEGEDDGGG